MTLRVIEGRPREGQASPVTGLVIGVPDVDFVPRMMTVATVAERLAVTERHVRQLLADGDLPAYRIGRAVRIPEPALAEYLEARRVK